MFISDSSFNKDPCNFGTLALAIKKSLSTLGKIAIFSETILNLLYSCSLFIRAALGSSSSSSKDYFGKINLDFISARVAAMTR